MSRSVVCGLICGLWCVAVLGQEADLTENVPVLIADEAPVETPLPQLIEELSAASFASRQAAAKKLLAAGVPGVQAVSKSAETDDLDLALTCVGILRDALQSTDKAVSQAARSALEKLAQSPQKSVAQRAKLALEPAPEINPGGAFIPGAPPFGIIAGGGMKIRVQIQQGNGTRHITVQENDKEIVIDEVTGTSLTITVTEPVEGKKQSQTYKAKDAAEMKLKHPEIHAVYEKYTARNARIPRGFGNQGVLIPGVPGFAPVPGQGIQRRRLVNPLKAAVFVEQVDEIQQEIAKLTDKLALKLKDPASKPNDLLGLVEQLQQANEKLKAAQTGLDQP